MHSTIISSIKHHIYKARESETLMSEVSRIICVLMPHAFLVAGLNTLGKIKLAQYYGYDKQLEPWHNDFFEQVLKNEPLLGDLSILPKVFIASGKQIIVPDELYTREDAEAWLRSMHFVEADEAVYAYHLDDDKAQLVFAAPHTGEALAKRYFNHATIRPLNAYQYQCEETNVPFFANGTFMEESGWVSIRKNGKLVWNHYFAYSNAEEIAYYLAAACKEHEIPHSELTVQFGAVCPELQHLAAELKAFFPMLRDDNIAPDDATYQSWAPVLYMIQQMNKCVS